MKRILALSPLILAACQLAEPRDVMGNFDVSYTDNLRVYVNDVLVAEVTSGERSTGEGGTFEWNGESFDISTVCSDEGVECPAETFWGSTAVDQPWGVDYKLLNFVNLDQEHGVPGVRMGGVMEDDGSFAMLSGLGLAANGNCAALGVGTVSGFFSDDGTQIVDGVIAYGYAAGCSIDGVDFGATLRLETDFVAERTGDYDISSVEAAEPIDEEGAEVDPEEPEEEYAVEQ